MLGAGMCRCSGPLRSRRAKKKQKKLPMLKDGGKQLTFLPDWCRAEITEIQDLTYGVIPKLLPCEAIKELLTKQTEQQKVS